MSSTGHGLDLVRLCNNYYYFNGHFIIYGAAAVIRPRGLDAASFKQRD